MKFNRKIEKFDSSGIRKIFDLAVKIKNPINLSIGEPDFSMPEILKKEAIKALKNNRTKYTQTAGLPELREKIAEKLKKENKINGLSKENIIVTTGTSGGLQLLFQVLLNPGDEVIIIDPYFVLYKQVPGLFGANVKIVSSYPDFSLPLEKIEKTITRKTKMVIINSPNNPTGKVYSKKELLNLIAILKKKNILLISDEIYEKFNYSNNHFSPASVYKNAVTLNGFSKAYAMTGLRIGYVSGPQEIISQMIKLQQYTYVCAPSISQYIALKALNINSKILIAEYEVKRDLIYEGLKNYFDVEKPEGAFYIFPKVKEGKAPEFAERAIKHNLLIVPGSVFSQKDNHIRVSFAASNETIKKGIKILKDIAK